MNNTRIYTSPRNSKRRIPLRPSHHVQLPGSKASAPTPESGLYINQPNPPLLLTYYTSPTTPFPTSNPNSASTRSLLLVVVVQMETTVRVPFSPVAAPKCRTHLPSRSLALRAHKFGHKDVGSLRFIPSDYIGNSIEVRMWESGKSFNDIAACQGISVRRIPPPGSLKHEESTPSSILEKIIWNKDVEVAEMKERQSLEMLKKNVDDAPPVRDFVGALRASHVRTGLPALIAEVKKASPSRGVLREDFNPVEIATSYQNGGAACLSVLTDKKFFQGSFENLEAIRSAGIQCPLLCKEFVIDVWQIYYARTKGADAILLIAAVLTDLDIKYFTKICRSLGLAALIEVHNEREMDRVLAIDGIELIGINNRDLETFEVNLSNTKRLLEGERGEAIRERDIIVVGESALFTPADIAYVQEAGVRAVLVGESLVKQKDPQEGIAKLFGKDISPTR